MGRPSPRQLPSKFGRLARPARVIEPVRAAPAKKASVVAKPKKKATAAAKPKAAAKSVKKKAAAKR